MAWIESHQTLGHHPKTLRLAREWKCSVVAAVGHLHFLWWWCLDFAPNGQIPDESRGVVAQACLWRGDVDRFWAGLEAAGFVEGGCDYTLSIHDWMDYAGRLIQKREANRHRMREKRAAHVQRTSGARATHVQGLPDQPTGESFQDSPLPTPPNPHDAAATGPSARRGSDPPKPVAQDCPICHRTFIGSYSEHKCVPISRPPMPIGTFMRPPQRDIPPAEVEAELAAIGEQQRARGQVLQPAKSEEA